MFQFPDKSMFKSLTAWGVFLLVAGREAEKVGFLPVGLTDAIEATAQPLGALLAGLGVRGLAGAAIAALQARSAS